VQKLNTGLNAALRTPDVIARFDELNVESRANTPEEFGKFVQEQMDKWSQVVKEANIKLG
jgi:tripartite-type tricarboxylate transporter receptor subunit TctC